MTRRSVDDLRDGLRRNRELLADDRGSLPMALLLIMIGMALAAALLPTMIVQDRATVFDGTRTDNLAAAQAGIDVAVGEIRAAGPTGVGNATALPCTSAPSSPIAGKVNGVGKAAYSVVVSYFVTDPVASPPPPAGTNQPMVCVAGRGTYDAPTASFVPSYALITSTGTDGVTAASNSGGSLGRTITATYVFKTINKNFLGGQIRIYPPNTLSTTIRMCMDAGLTPVVGTPIIMQPCSTATPPSNQQLFSYRSDLTLQLTTAVTAANPNGLCLDTDTGIAGPAITSKVILNQCSTLGGPVYSQQWSFNDNGGFTASVLTTATTGGFGLPGYGNGLCISVATQNAGQTVGLADCGSGGTSSPTQAWLPAPSVGAGAAAAPQLVNYQQFGRCLDITGKNVSANPNIAYPCKQNPHPGSVAWNQLFTFNPVSGWLYTTTGGVQYCLYSPRTEGGYVRLDQCSNLSWLAGVTAGQLVWSQPGNTTATSYPQRYTFVDSSTDVPRCLGISAPPSGDTSPWYYITVATCNGSTAQKWNADPNLDASALQNTIEE